MPTIDADTFVLPVWNKKQSLKEAEQILLLSLSQEAFSKRSNAYAHHQHSEAIWKKAATKKLQLAPDFVGLETLLFSLTFFLDHMWSHAPDGGHYYVVREC